MGTSVGAALVKMDHPLAGAFPFWFGSILVIMAAVLVFIFVREPEYEKHEGEENQKVPAHWMA